jgi:hypothetical protein
MAGPQQRKRESRNDGRTGGVGMPALPAAVAVMTYRLISAWLVLLAGWVLFLVISARRARRAAAQAAPAAVNLTTSTSTSTSTPPPASAVGTEVRIHSTFAVSGPC